MMPKTRDRLFNKTFKDMKKKRIYKIKNWKVAQYNRHLNSELR